MLAALTSPHPWQGGQGNVALPSNPSLNRCLRTPTFFCSGRLHLDALDLHRPFIKAGYHISSEKHLSLLNLKKTRKEGEEEEVEVEEEDPFLDHWRHSPIPTTTTTTFLEGGGHGHTLNIGAITEDCRRAWAVYKASNIAPPRLPTLRQKQESAEKDNYYANMGSAIRSLREDLPHLFRRDLNYNIYRDDIVFREPQNTLIGIESYKLISWALRFHGQIFFKAIWVDVVRIWQPCDRVIMVRWAVRGIPRVPWEAQGSFEGTSEYKLDKHGKIFEHKVDNVLLNHPPRYKVPSVLDILAGCQPITPPTPTFYIGANTLSLVTWLSFYQALVTTLDLDNRRSIELETQLPQYFLCAK